MSAIVDALLAELDDRALDALAERLRPYLERDRAGDRLLTPAEAAARLNLHPKTLARAAAVGRVHGAVRVGRSWRFHADQLHLEAPPSVKSTPVKPPRPRTNPGTGTADAIRGPRP